MIQKLLNLFIGFFLLVLLIVIPFRMRSTTQVSLSQSPENLLVSAAASLQSSLQGIDVINSAKVTYNFGASGALQHQIEQGAPIDVFISAGVKQMDNLESKGLLAFRTNLLTNRLALITPKDSLIKLTNFSQLLNPKVKRIAIADPRSVPVGQYATEVLRYLGILEKLQPKFVLGNNVRFVLAAVESGEVDAGIVYITDAKSSGKVITVAIADQKLHSPIIYPIGIIKSSSNPEAAKQYLQFLQSDKALAIFQRKGFGTIPK